MDQLSLLFDGFANAITPANLLWVFLGALLGTAVGVLPGLGSAMAVALLLPITFSLDEYKQKEYLNDLDSLDNVLFVIEE